MRRDNARARIGRHALLAAAVLLVMAGMAYAIPTNPDPCHTAPCTPWSAVNPFNPNADAHQHRNAQVLFNMNAMFKTYSVWDDRVYRYNAIMDRPLNKAQDMQDYGHGFINVAPRYVFDNNAAAKTDVPAWARPLIAQVIDQWAAAVNELGANSNGIPTETKIQFQQVAPGVANEILIRFADSFPVGGANPDQPFPEPGNINSDGSAVIPAIPGGAPMGGRSGILAFWTPSTRVLTFSRKLDTAMQWYRDDTGNPADNVNPNIQGMKFDFYTTALHEWGHVLGLDHPMNPNAGTTMQPTQGKRFLLNSGIIRTIDPGSLDGAKDLYTIIRCPPPAMMMPPPPPGPCPVCMPGPCPVCPGP